MLLKVLIVDDDIVARTSLSTMLDWEEHGFTLVGSAINGEHAIHLIENDRPDIVITDMSMSIMDWCSGSASMTPRSGMGLTFSGEHSSCIVSAPPNATSR